MTDMLLELVFHYRYWGLFAAMSLGIVGLPMPDEVLLTSSGYLLAQGKMTLGWTMLAAIGGSLVGMSISFAAGAKVGRPLLARFGAKLKLTPERLAKHEERSAKWGNALILIGYFIPGLRHMTALLIGMGRRPYRPFLSYAAIGALLWTSSFELVGMMLGEHWREVTALLHRDAAMIVFGGAAVLAAGWLWGKAIMKRRAS